METGQIKMIKASTDNPKKTASNMEAPIRWRLKNNKLHPMFNNALRTKKITIRANFSSAISLFQTIMAEIVAKIKRIVQTVPIINPGGVHDGRLMDLYQLMPPEVK